MRALVTGASGFVGGHLIDLLCASGGSVVGLGRRRLSPSTVQACWDFRYIIGDVSDGAALRSLLGAERFDAVFHLAGLTAFSSAADIYRTNVAGTLALLDALRSLRRPELKVVLLGSSAQYGAALDDPITEETPLVPVGDYGASKREAEQLGRACFEETGQAILFARGFNFVGPGRCPPLLHAAVARQLVEIERGARSPVIEVGNLGAYRDFVDVRDSAAGLIALAAKGRPGEAYNICSGRATQAGFVVEHLVRLAGIPVETRISRNRNPGVDIPFQRGSFAKIERATGWKPTRSLETSLADTLAYWRAAGPHDAA